MTNQYDVAIAGAGIVGMSTALWAQRRGLKAVICDANSPGSGTTFGSACTMATYACVPINSPSVITSLPSLLFSKQSPLTINYLYALKHWRWMLSFLLNCRQSRVDAIGAELGALLRQADAGLDPLIEDIKAEDLMVEEDCLYVWSTKKGFDGAAKGNDLRRRQGVEMEELNASDVRALEPALQMPIYRGLRFRGTRFILHPQKLVERMQRRFAELGGVTLLSSVNSVTFNDVGTTANLADGTSVNAGHFVVAAGAHSKSIDGAGLEKVPLGVERGYHVTYANHRNKLSRPVGWAEAGLYATPMELGLRFAGTVELDDLNAPPTLERGAYLRRRATEMFGSLDGDADDWLGYRPTLPDALPVIGPSTVSDRIIHAFGHQHIGLTLGGLTGRMVTDIVTGKERTPNVSGIGSQRFHQG
ncbi:D-amino-acid dehydrogenase [Roseovarius lutimaris]|uniref:D-amino-acid dehydrogenase n=1 Tax=Roseovarius lutimaris TaxID=1005928 RepID=A0A1I5H4N8_9RHOB|nr:FAD-dependent oxidoreductase [Roseovarius lutimaris]SFO42801.1 D-amino-acid dehydrogenase [Roseovarius lutimaris]